MPPLYWVESLASATYLLNRLPTTALASKTPFEQLFNKPPICNHLRVFGCICYPNLSSIAANKASPHSKMCVLLGYPSSHNGYRCLGISTQRVIISWHVVFDEHTFPFASSNYSLPADVLDFLLDFATTSSLSPVVILATVPAIVPTSCAIAPSIPNDLID